MTKPQQPELRRSGKGSTDQDSAKAKADLEGAAGAGSGELGPVPPGNQPGWQGEERPVKTRDE